MESLMSPYKIFRALAHPARVRIVQELSDGGEKCVCDLVKACGLGWSTTSRHLSVLRTAGVIVDEKRGLQIFSRLKLKCVAQFIDCIEQQIPESAERKSECCF